MNTSAPQADRDALARDFVQFAIDAHVELFSRKSPVPVLWEPVQAVG